MKTHEYESIFPIEEPLASTGTFECPICGFEKTHAHTHQQEHPEQRIDWWSKERHLFENAVLMDFVGGGSMQQVCSERLELKKQLSLKRTAVDSMDDGTVGFSYKDKGIQQLWKMWQAAVYSRKELTP